MVRTRHDPEAKREQFIATALELFARKGVGNTSLRDVIKAMNGGAGTSPSVFYYYFASKGDLFEACFSTYMDGYIQDLADILDDRSCGVREMAAAARVRLGESIDMIGRMVAGDTDERDGSLSHSLSLTLQNQMFEQSLFERLMARAAPHIASALDFYLASKELPETVLTNVVGTAGIAMAICGGIHAMLHTQTTQDAGAKEALAFVSQLLGTDLTCDANAGGEAGRS